MGKGGGGSAPAPTQVVQQESSLPAFLEAPLSRLVSRAESESQQPYQRYGGQRIAGFSAPETQSFQMVQDSAGAYKPYMTEAAGLVRGATGFDQNTFNQYMNPYMTGVVDRIAETGNRNLMENILPGINDTFIRSGQGIGSSRNADFTLRAIRDTQNEILGRQAEALAGAHDSAMSNYQQGQDRSITAGTTLGNLGAAEQDLGLRAASAVGDVGAAQRAMDQSRMDLAYSDFLEQRDAPKSNLNFLSSIIRGLPVNNLTTSTQTTSAAQPNTLAQLAGIGLGTYYGMKAKGGKIRRSPKRVASKSRGIGNIKLSG